MRFGARSGLRYRRRGFCAECGHGSEHCYSATILAQYYTKQSNPHSVMHSLFYRQNMHRVNYLEMQTHTIRASLCFGPLPVCPSATVVYTYQRRFIGGEKMCDEPS
jgi:hypothetical protein